MSQARFQKQQREKARREKAAAKWARRVERRAATQDEPPAESIDEAALLAELAELHARFEAGEVTFDDFSDAKDALVGRLDVR